MQDRVPTPGQEGRVKITPEGGGATYYAKIEMADNPTQAGDEPIKANLLPDAVATALGLTGNPQVKDALLAARTTAILNIWTVPGATVAVALGGVTLTATAGWNGLAVLYPPKLGTWSVTVTSSSDTYTGLADVTVIGIMPVWLPTFSAMSWTDIGVVGQAGAATNVFTRGDKKNVVLTTGETITFRLEDFNHDDLVSGGKAPISLMMGDLLAASYDMDPEEDDPVDWGTSIMRSRMSTFLAQMPADLRAVIKPVKKKTASSGRSPAIQTTNDSIWLASRDEVGAGAEGEGDTYPLFVDDASRIKKKSNGAGAAQWWWLRSLLGAGGATFISVSEAGSTSGRGAASSGGVCLGLCV